MQNCCLRRASRAFPDARISLEKDGGMSEEQKSRRANSPGASGPSGLEVRDLRAGYGAEDVLSGVSFTLPAGASLAIAGESGCGKSTLLRTLAGLLPAASGSVIWRSESGEAVARPHSSFVWQTLGLFPWKTVRENLELPFRLANTRAPGEEAGRLVAQMLAELGLDGLADRHPARLSGGQRQRLALGRALIARPEALFMDEPFSALDALRRERLQDLLARMRTKRRLTMLFVTHDISEAVFLGSHVLLLAARPGRILDFFENPAWRPEEGADRESPVFAEVARRIHATLRRAAPQED